jgi:hypothetical protein
MWKTVLAIIGGVWIVGRLSRLSPNHPTNSLGIALRFQIAAAAAAPVSPGDQLQFTNDYLYPYNGPGEETAQIQSTLVVGEGGGE